MNETIIGHVQRLLFFGLLAFITHRFARKQGLLSLPPDSPTLPISCKALIALFAIYLAMLFFASGLLRFMQEGAQSAVQLMAMISAAILMFLFCARYHPELLRKVFSKEHLWKNLGLGMAFWLLSFPMVMAIGQFFELLVAWLFGPSGYEQVAISVLKKASGSLRMLLPALVMILLAAPVLEEFLFRGLLQNVLKRYLPRKWAIALAALGFALFHVAPSQGIGNISLSVSIFTFGCYLGFLYERIGSLYACIGLHLTFNLISVLRILI